METMIADAPEGDRDVNQGDGIPDEGVIRLGQLSGDTIVTEATLCKLFGRHPASVKRAVRRRELPPPVKMFGQPCWTVKAILDHFEARLVSAARAIE